MTGPRRASTPRGAAGGHGRVSLDGGKRSDDLSRSWRVSLPMLAPPLRDNQRLHWAVKARIVAQLRGDMPAVARAAGLPTGLDRVRVVLHWQPKLRRGRDQLSIAPTLKPLVDGLVDYGLVPDDTIDHVELSCRIEPLGAWASVWLVVTDLGVL